MFNQIITVLPSRNLEYHTGSSATINGDHPKVLSALSKVESNLIQKYYYAKHEIINRRNMIFKNPQILKEAS